jgi:hypothetical protein
MMKSVVVVVVVVYDVVYDPVCDVLQSFEKIFLYCEVPLTDSLHHVVHLKHIEVLVGAFCSLCLISRRLLHAQQQQSDDSTLRPFFLMAAQRHQTQSLDLMNRQFFQHLKVMVDGCLLHRLMTKTSSLETIEMMMTTTMMMMMFV